MKPIIALAALSGTSLVAHAASSTTTSFVVNANVPDNNPGGLTNRQTLSSTITAITDVQVQLNMSGGWCGDMYAYLVHGTGFSVLLNRPGRALDNLSGSGVSDFTITLTDTALGDIHTMIANSGTFTGFYQPDGRETDPDNSLDTSPRTALLSSFNGLAASGEWTLYVADVSTGNTMALNSWSLTVTGVPEPSSAALALLGMLGLLRRQRHNR